MLKSTIKSKVHFFYPKNTYRIRGSSGLKLFIEKLVVLEGKRLETMSYIFCSDQILLSINKKYLDHHYYTDIVTFDLSDKKGVILGESYVSIDRVRINATRMNISLRKELLRVVFHGILHLCGYNDKTQKESLIMRKKEDYYLSLYLKH